MARTGAGWMEVMAMDIEQFFYVIHVTEPKKDKAV